jgi:hypothetical protein
VSAEGLAWRYYRIRSNVGVGGGPPSALRDAFRWANIGIWQNLCQVTIFRSLISLLSHNRPVGTVGCGLAPVYAVISNLPSSAEILLVVVPERTTRRRMFDVDVARRRKNDGPFEDGKSWRWTITCLPLFQKSPTPFVVSTCCPRATPPQHHLHNINLYLVLNISVCCSFRPASDM